ncbi:MULTISPECIES: hypothetical protein [unclassified Flavobacterium]|uniref:hypothetical protein n=1 Tax=unclassified Flavobacterium TaxID=196869 RepID=UPI00129275B9|nr:MULTISPECIES: hypothetical protein [unclassified Flavobacterium]MQP53678.1 hypothetical protein [Flavobacterium sp. LMO9]MQP63609.1 hypothetical protein [Flavobacterium sp. LMO6]
MTITIKHFLSIIFLTFFFSQNLNAQRHKTKDVLKIADSILSLNVNPEIIKYFKGYTGSYQKYKNGKYYSHRGFTHKTKLNKNVEEIWILYHFNFPEVEDLTNGTWLKLDKNLNLIEPINLSFIPQFLLENRKCDFITKQEALKIGIENFKESGIKINEPILIFNKETNSYVYRVENVLTKSKNIIGKDTGKTEVLIINSLSGEIIERLEGLYGIIIR